MLSFFIPVWFLGYSINKAGKLREIGERELKVARTAYESSLELLRENPTDPELRSKTLELGRHYSNLTRNRLGVTTYDELALKNDIDAACAAAISMVNMQPQAVRDEKDCPHCAEPILAKANVCKHCGRDVAFVVEDLSEEARFETQKPEIIRIKCWCGKQLKIAAKHSGRKFKCPACGEIIRVSG